MELPHYPLADALIESGRLSESEALDAKRIERELSAIVLKLIKEWRNA